MSEQEDTERDRREMRVMWIFSAVVVALIVGGMGLNMLIHHDTSGSNDTSEISSQSRQAPPK